MKIVVVGGSGLIGSKLVTKLREHGHEALDASPKTGFNSLTGEGLSEVLGGADVVVDVSNSSSFGTAAVMDFFTTSTGNILAAEGCCRRKPPRRAVGRRYRRPCSHFGAQLSERTLIPDGAALLGTTRFEDWLSRPTAGV